MGSDEGVALHPGASLRGGRYRMLARLAEGGSGQVWRALDTREGREVAIKAIPLGGGGAEAAEREAEAVARVRHPGVVQVHGTFLEGDVAFIVMELARRDLAAHLDLHGPLSGPQARGVAKSLAEVLAAAHAAGVVHRDLKPQNVLVMPDGSVRLGDFGIARLHARGHTRTGALLGTLPFMAPEQRRDARDVRPATDVYAWAALLSWMRTGSAPGDLFAPEALVTLGERLRACGELDPGLLGVIARCGRYAPGERPRDGEALLAELTDWADEERLTLDDGSCESWDGEGAPPPPRNAPPPVPGSSPVGAGGWRAGALVLVGVALASGIGAAVARWGAATGAPVALSSSVTASEAFAAELAPCEGGLGTLLPVVRPGPEETLAASAFDLDGDGLDEAIYTNQQAETLTIWWGKRGGILVEAASVPAGRSAAPALLLEEGGVRQLLLPRADTGDIARWKVEGRSLTRLASIAQPGSPRGAVLAHWDEDATLDLVVNTEPCLMVRPGDGKGGFPTGICVAMQPYAEARGTLEMNGRQLVLLRGDDAVALYDGGADGVPRLREAPPVPRGAMAAFGRPELYATLPDQITLGRWTRRGGAPLGADDAWRGCAWARGQLDGRALHTLADLDGDDVPEVIGSRTCAGCTSNQVGWRR